jgi:DNA replicative helicase MCM subunit Mcm2 (Cdc46/Mcm family)
VDRFDKNLTSHNVVLLVGRPGLGKSDLLVEAARIYGRVIYLPFGGTPVLVSYEQDGA